MQNKIVEYIKRPLSREQREDCLVYGNISVNENFQKFIEPGGMVHVRVTSLTLKRAVIFKQYKNISFPFDYEILGADVLIPSRFRDTFSCDFYVEVFYIPKGKDYRDRPNCPGGEAWGRAGKLYPLKAGDKADVEIAFFWTPELMKGELTKPSSAINAMWVDAKEELKKYIGKKNKLTISLKTINNSNVKEELLVAQKEIYNIKKDELPMMVNFYADEFKVPVNNSLRVYYQVVLESLGDDNSKKVYLYGLRASPWVKISPRVQSLRLVLFLYSEKHPSFTKELYNIS